MDRESKIAILLTHHVAAGVVFAMTYASPVGFDIVMAVFVGLLVSASVAAWIVGPPGGEGRWRMEVG